MTNKMRQENLIKFLESLAHELKDYPFWESKRALWSEELQRVAKRASVRLGCPVGSLITCPNGVGSFRIPIKCDSLTASNTHVDIAVNWGDAVRDCLGPFEIAVINIYSDRASVIMEL